MKRAHFTQEQIIAVLREAEQYLSAKATHRELERTSLRAYGGGRSVSARFHTLRAKRHDR